jgi:DNA-binding transcriptional MerR regulator
MPPPFAIGEFARRSGFAASTIRYCERIGLLPSPQRLNGKRRYDDGILPTLRLIRLAQRVGLTIEEIQALLHDFPADAPPALRWQTFAPAKLRDVDALLRKIEAQRTLLLHTLECQCQTLEQCAQNPHPLE